MGGWPFAICEIKPLRTKHSTPGGYLECTPTFAKVKMTLFLVRICPVAPFCSHSCIVPNICLWLQFCSFCNANSKANSKVERS